MLNYNMALLFRCYLIPVCLLFPHLCTHKDIDECSSDPCMNDGTCQDLIDGYICTCAFTFKGETCSESVVVFSHGCNIRIRDFQPYCGRTCWRWDSSATLFTKSTNSKEFCCSSDLISIQPHMSNSNGFLFLFARWCLTWIFSVTQSVKINN